MLGFNLLPFFIFGFFISCEGKVNLPAGGANLTFLPGRDAKIPWSFTDDLSDVSIRSWFLKHSGGETPTLLARIIGAGSTPVFLQSGFAVEGMATLVIKNFNESRNGEYRFTLSGLDASDVTVSVIKRPNIILNCSSPVLLKMGEDFSCLCRAVNGNPAPDVIWIKDGKEIGDERKYNKTLTINTNDWRNRGTYTCRAESYPDVAFRDEKSIEVIIYFKPINIKIELLPNPAVIDGSVTIKCSSDGFPEPNYVITHNETRLVTTEKEITLHNVQWNDTGTYKCLANNSLGSDSKSEFLEVKGTVTTSTTSTKPTKSTSTTKGENGGGDVKSTDKKNGLSDGAIAGIVIGVLAFIVIIGFLVYYFYFRSGENDGYRGKRDVSPGGRNDNQYEMGDNEYDTVKPGDGGEGSGEKPKKKNQPPVYAQVDKENRQGKPLYATLDTVALDSGGSKKRDEGRAQPTEYAAIDHSRTGDVPRADLV